ncbi:hypothetical protein Taro_009421, partial [Colocasia esculenta]|nr:hypothetical protein [Colocasia esculenta]
MFAWRASTGPQWAVTGHDGPRWLEMATTSNYSNTGWLLLLNPAVASAAKGSDENTRGAGSQMASRSAATAAALRSSDMEKMNVEQVKAVKEQSDLEVNLLQDSLNKIRTATARLEIASNALHDLSLRPQGKLILPILSLSKILVPLTASLYVPGTLDDAEKVLVDVGTGYFIE